MKMLAKDSVNPSLTWLKLFSQMCEFASCCTMESPIHRTSGSPSLASETKRWCIDIHRLSPCTSSTALAVAAEHLRRKKITTFRMKPLLFLQTFSLLLLLFLGSLVSKDGRSGFHESLCLHPPTAGLCPKTISISLSPTLRGIRSKSSQQSVFGSANATD